MVTEPFPSRSELVNKTAVMNQMRNAVYHLMRYLKSKNVTDLKPELLDMGKNLGTSFSYEVKIPKGSVEENLRKIYEVTIHSKLSVHFSKDGKYVDVVDEKCPLCKINYEDIDTAGCFVIMGMVDSLMKSIGHSTFRPVDVIESKVTGHNVCKHRYEI